MADAFARTIEGTLSMASPRPAARAPAAEPPASGARRFETLGELGRGGMGRVVEARDLQFGRRVAVKYLHGGADAEAERRFTIEALVTGNLEHPAIPTVYERGAEEDGTPYYAMRRVPGRTLNDTLAEAPDLAARLKLLPVVTRAAQPIAFAHDQGVIHRDIKPHNIVVGPYGEAVVVDWGIAKVRGIPVTESPPAADPSVAAPGAASTAHGLLLGTPAYMAPEQAAGRTAEIDERTDVFALGAMLYHILAGRAPYGMQTVEAAIDRARAAAPEPISRLVPSAPPTLVAVCERAMARHPGDRYQGAKDLADALETAAADALTGQRSAAARWFAGFAAGAALIMLIVGSAVVWRWMSSLSEQGLGAFFYVGIAVVGCALSAVEFATRGRHHIAPLALSFALITVLLGIGAFSTGFGRAMADARAIEDPARFRRLLSSGFYEASGCLSSTAMLGALQILLWGITARRTRGRETR